MEELQAGFLHDLAANRIPGLYPINKYGYDPDSDAADEDITPIGDLTVPTVSRTHNLVSTDAADTGDCWIQGVDQDYNMARIGEEVDVDGVGGNDTVLDGGYLFIHRMRYKGHGGVTNVGVISADADVDGSETGRISIGAGQTQSCFILIPATVDGYTVRCATITQFSGGVLRPSAAPSYLTVQLWEKPFGECWQQQEALALNSNSPNDDYPFLPPKRIEPKSWVKLTANGSTADNIVWGRFSVVLDFRD